MVPPMTIKRAIFSGFPGLSCVINEGVTAPSDSVIALPDTVTSLEFVRTPLVSVAFPAMQLHFNYLCDNYFAKLSTNLFCNVNAIGCPLIGMLEGCTHKVMLDQLNRSTPNFCY